MTMYEFSGLIISGIGVIHDLVKTYGDLRTWKEEDLLVDDEWLSLAIEKDVLPGPESGKENQVSHSAGASMLLTRKL
jgi:hypothetical protein